MARTALCALALSSAMRAPWHERRPAATPMSSARVELGAAPVRTVCMLIPSASCWVGKSSTPWTSAGSQASAGPPGSC
eukprot:13467330-Alexandrium_andersonii.AAC.1